MNLNTQDTFEWQEDPDMDDQWPDDDDFITDNIETFDFGGVKTAPCLAPKADLREQLLEIEVQERRFELTQRRAIAYSNSSMVPMCYQVRGNLANCIMAIEMADRLGAHLVSVFQNFIQIGGQPCMTSKFLISIFNNSGRFTPIEYKFVGTLGTDDYGCRAAATCLSTGDDLVGPLVNVALAKAEGWYSMVGSKWPTMTELMLTYRSAAFFIRTVAPELIFGLQTTEEVIDTIGSGVSNQPSKLKEAMGSGKYKSLEERMKEESKPLGMTGQVVSEGISEARRDKLLYTIEQCETKEEIDKKWAAFTARNRLTDQEASSFEDIVLQRREGLKPEVVEKEQEDPEPTQDQPEPEQECVQGQGEDPKTFKILSDAKKVIFGKRTEATIAKAVEDLCGRHTDLAQPISELGIVRLRELESKSLELKWSQLKDNLELCETQDDVDEIAREASESPDFSNAEVDRVLSMASDRVREIEITLEEAIG